MTTTAPIRSSRAPAPTFAGFYLRGNLGGTGALPAPGPYGLCPDIIGSPTPVLDPGQAFSSPESWATMYAVDPVLGATNYYYLRGYNGAGDALSGSLALHWANAQLIPFPSLWKGNELVAADGAPNLAVEATSGHIGVGDGAFAWKRPPLLPDPGDYFTFVAQASDSATPPPVPVIGSWLDMSSLLTLRPDIGLRNTATVDGSASTWYRRVYVDVPASMPSGQIALSVTTKGFVGNTIGFIGDLFSSDQKPMVLLPAQVNQDGAASSITVTLEGGMSTSFALQYWNTGPAPADGATIVFSADYLVADSELAEAGSRALVHPARSVFVSRALGIGPTAALPLGAANFTVAS